MEGMRRWSGRYIGVAVTVFEGHLQGLSRDQGLTDKRFFAISRRFANQWTTRVHYLALESSSFSAVFVHVFRVTSITSELCYRWQSLTNLLTPHWPSERVTISLNDANPLNQLPLIDRQSFVTDSHWDGLRPFHRITFHRIIYIFNELI